MPASTPAQTRSGRAASRPTTSRAGKRARGRRRVRPALWPAAPADPRRRGPPETAPLPLPQPALRGDAQPGKGPPGPDHLGAQQGKFGLGVGLRGHPEARRPAPQGRLQARGRPHRLRSVPPHPTPGTASGSPHCRAASGARRTRAGPAQPTQQGQTSGAGQTLTFPPSRRQARGGHRRRSIRGYWRGAARPPGSGAAPASAVSRPTPPARRVTDHSCAPSSRRPKGLPRHRACSAVRSPSGVTRGWCSKRRPGGSWAASSPERSTPAFHGAAPVLMRVVEKPRSPGSFQRRLKGPQHAQTGHGRGGDVDLVGITCPQGHGWPVRVKQVRSMLPSLSQRSPRSSTHLAYAASPGRRGMPARLGPAWTPRGPCAGKPTGAPRTCREQPAGCGFRKSWPARTSPWPGWTENARRRCARAFGPAFGARLWARHHAACVLDVLRSGERLVGEWLAVHPTRYALPHEAFVALDLVAGPSAAPSSRCGRGWRACSRCRSCTARKRGTQLNFGATSWRPSTRAITARFSGPRVLFTAPSCPVKLDFSPVGPSRIACPSAIRGGRGRAAPPLRKARGSFPKRATRPGHPDLDFSPQTPPGTTCLYLPYILDAQPTTGQLHSAHAEADLLGAGVRKRRPEAPCDEGAFSCVPHAEPAQLGRVLRSSRFCTYIGASTRCSEVRAASLGHGHAHIGRLRQQSRRPPVRTNKLNRSCPSCRRARDWARATSTSSLRMKIPDHPVRPLCCPAWQVHIAKVRLPPLRHRFCLRPRVDQRLLNG